MIPDENDRLRKKLAALGVSIEGRIKGAVANGHQGMQSMVGPENFVIERLESVELDGIHANRHVCEHVHRIPA